MSLLTATTQIWLGYFVALVMASGAIVNAVGPAGIRAAYARWGYPSYMRFVTGSIEAAALALILVGATRAIGLSLAAAVLLAAIGTLLRAREYAHTLPALITLVAAVLALAR